MKKIVTIAAISMTLMFNIGCSGDHHNEHNDGHTKKAHHAHWGYEGKGGPYTWGDLDPAYHMCGVGKMQTPINIIATKNIDLEPLILNYHASSKNLVNNGHSVQVNINEGSSLVIDGKEFDLKQFHFHTPSENNLYGESFPLEAHFVHVSDSGDIAVIGVMFQFGEENEILAKIWSKFPHVENQNVPIEIDARDILRIMPKDKDYYKFMGSLTTPPCTEGVHWIVYKNPVTISKEQVRKFFHLYGHPNNRPIQRSNDRTIYR